MKKLLLLSVSTIPGQKYLEYALPWVAKHFNASPKTPRTILFVPYAVKDHVLYAQRVSKALNPLGINVISAHRIKQTARLDKMDGIFIGGGNTFRLLGQLQKTGLLDAIKKAVEAGLPYMGSSAGTNVACQTIMTTNDMPIIQLASLNALNLVPFQINPHYIDGQFFYMKEKKKIIYSGETREKRIAQFHEENGTPVIGLREGSALRIIGDEAALLGNVSARLFRRGKKPMELKSRSRILISKLHAGARRAK